MDEPGVRARIRIIDRRWPVALAKSMSHRLFQNRFHLFRVSSDAEILPVLRFSFRRRTACAVGDPTPQLIRARTHAPLTPAPPRCTTYSPQTRPQKETAMGNRDKQGREKKKPKKTAVKPSATPQPRWTPSYKPTPTPPTDTSSS